ncbi:helix-turn-helix transcriptional regulator [Sphingobacterium allocomposti]|nr:YafY family protein [Sphingobacterium composti Yoo et al. 2007 non Ten et al. 2007]HLS95101.1 YafY family protein [Sphingobacterium sp.]
MISLAMDITKRFHRIIAIYFQLQGRSIVKAQDLAQRFDVSVRTIYRDIRALEQAGIPIYGEAGTGYSLTEGYKLPPTSFTKDEILSIAASEKLMQKFVDPDLFRHFSTAIDKVRSYLRYSDKNNIMHLEDNLVMQRSSAMFNEAVPDALSVLFESISLQKIAELTYQAIHRNEPNERRIEAVGIFHEGHFWYFIAYCHLREDYRQFRIDRIQKIKRTDDPFTRKHKPLHYYLDKKAPAPTTKVRVRVNKDFARYLQWDRIYYGFVSEEITTDHVEMTFQSKNVENEFARWYLMFADQATILEPEELKDHVRSILTAIQL